MTTPAPRTLNAFLQITLDGYFAGEDGDMSWAHKRDPEWNAWVDENAKGGGAMLFGRVTFAQMESFWPTPAGKAMAPRVAERMTTMPKYVASRTVRSSDWEHTTFLEGDLVEAVTALKASPGPNIVILGSGSLVTQLTDAGLIDGYQLVINPFALGAGRPVFMGIAKPTGFTLEKTRAFANGNVVLWYAKKAG